MAKSRRGRAVRRGRGRPASEAPRRQQKTPPAAGNAWRLRTLAAVAAVAALVLVAGLAGHLLGSGERRDAAGPGEQAVNAAYAGSETCAGCHQDEARLWRSSQHRHAMEHAREDTVLGDFDDASFVHEGVRSRFFRKGSSFFVETDGPDGALAAFEVKYTFGLSPLQQYLIEFPDGRLQALSIAWDSRPATQGGQRWFHLYPDEKIAHDDVLHWTKLGQNWNFMCAECHSTGVRKNYDAAKDRFATTWAEIHVGCETCHGQGSRHVAWARKGEGWWPFGSHRDPAKGLLVRFDEREGALWKINEETGNAARGAAAALRKEVETCGLCHARRGVFSEDWVPGRWLSETHRVTPLERMLNHADGQMRDVEETYNYGPFKQSKMFAKGVTCSDCHDPHSAALRAPGNGVCLQCHAPDKYKTAAHHHHGGVKEALGCVSCHMPARIYMGIDTRHDHGFRVPRPDLSVKFGTPNACTDCHHGKGAKWAADAVEGWFGPDRKGYQAYAEAFHAASTNQADAGKLLAAVASDGGTPAFVRASALSELSGNITRATFAAARGGLSSGDPLVRIAALNMLDGVPADRLWPLVSPLLADPVKDVRIRAVSVLAALPTERQPQADRDRFARAADEFIAAQRLNADRPEARTTLGAFLARRGRLAEAETELRAAMRLSPQFAPAAVNLADIKRQLWRDEEGIGILREALKSSPRDAGLRHALGLALARTKRTEEALAELRQAAELAPDRARYAYVYAVGMHSSGRGGEAIKVLDESLKRHPGDRETLEALIAFHRDRGDFAAALAHAERLARMAPDDANLPRLIEALRTRISQP